MKITSRLIDMEDHKYKVVRYKGLDTIPIDDLELFLDEYEVFRGRNGEDKFVFSRENVVKFFEYFKSSYSDEE